MGRQINQGNQVEPEWYVVDWDTVDSLEDLKTILKAASFAFDKTVASENDNETVLQVIEKYCVRFDPNG